MPLVLNSPNRLGLCIFKVTDIIESPCTVYPNKYAHGFVVLCFVVVMQSFIMNSHEVFIHIHQGCFAGTGAIVRLPQCQWSKPDRYGKISQCITTTKHSKAKTVCIFLGIYCRQLLLQIQLGSSHQNLGYSKSKIRPAARGTSEWFADQRYWNTFCGTSMPIFKLVYLDTS